MARKELPRTLKDVVEKTQQEKVEANKARHTSHHDLSGSRGKGAETRRIVRNGKR